MTGQTVKKTGSKTKKNKELKGAAKAPGKKAIRKIRKATAKLEKATERSFIAKDKADKILHRVEKIKINIHAGTAAGAPRSDLQRLRKSLVAIKAGLKLEEQNLAHFRKKIKKQKNKIKKLRTGK